MRKTTTLIAASLAAAGMLGLAGCDVKKTQEGNVSVPKYEVEKKQSGDVTLPKYDVTTPDVKVGTEKKTIEVPTVDVTTAKEKEKKQQGQGG